MGTSYIVDANAIIDYVGNKLPSKAALVMDELMDKEFITSIIVKIEVLGFNGAPVEMEALNGFLGLATLIYLDDLIANKAIELRRAHKKLKLGDALIAATALIHRLTVLSRNTKDFQYITGLDCVNPHEL